MSKSYNFLGHRLFLRVAVFSPDGRHALTASADGTARLFRTDGTGPSVVLRGHDAPIHAAVFSPDGQYIATGCETGAARIWRTDGTELPKVLIGHTRRVVSVAFSPDGTQLATGSWDQTARVWPVVDDRYVLYPSGDLRVWLSKDHELPVTLKGHTDHVCTVAFSPDGTQVLTGSYDGTARLWNADGTDVPVHEVPVGMGTAAPDVQWSRWEMDEIRSALTGAWIRYCGWRYPGYHDSPALVDWTPLRETFRDKMSNPCDVHHMAVGELQALSGMKWHDVKRVREAAERCPPGTLNLAEPVCVADEYVRTIALYQKQYDKYLSLISKLKASGTPCLGDFDPTVG